MGVARGRLGAVTLLGEAGQARLYPGWPNG